MAAQVARERAAEEQQRRNRLEAQARLDHKIQSFADKHGADGGWLDWKRLRANPFSYEGKILVFNASFEKMVSPTSGIFNGVLVTGLPRNAFLQPSDVLLAGKVRGTSDIKTESGGTGQVPHVEYVAHVSCQERNCKDYAGRLRK